MIQPLWRPISVLFPSHSGSGETLFWTDVREEADGVMSEFSTVLQ
jgi:hypothetical protein